MEQDEFELADLSDQEHSHEEDSKKITQTFLTIETHYQDVHFKIKDFLYTTGEHDLLSYWSFDDTALFLYKDSYVEASKEEQSAMLLEEYANIMKKTKKNM